MPPRGPNITDRRGLPVGQFRYGFVHNLIDRRKADSSLEKCLDGNFVGRVDFKLLDSPVVVEADGRANHSSKLDWQHDLDRRNLLTAQGLGVIHATWDKVMNRPDEFLAEVTDAQARRRT